MMTITHEDFGILLDDVIPQTLKVAFEQPQNPNVLHRLQSNTLHLVVGR